MSLLLDALKKAADDKAKNSRGQSLEAPATKVQAAEPGRVDKPSSEQLAEKYQMRPEDGEIIEKMAKLSKILLQKKVSLRKIW